ncbi:MAG: hypothetical protein ACYDAO_06840 [Thermoplasmataceae archaeon]
MSDKIVISEKLGLEILRRASMIAIGVVYIFIGNQLWGEGGYLNLMSLSGLFILLISAAFLFIFAFYGFESEKWKKRTMLLSILPGIIAMFISFSQFYPAFGTDEIAIDNYSAFLLIHGINPYIIPNVANFLGFSGLPSSYITPLLKGGHVDYIQYPGLSVLLFIPSAMFSFPPFYIVSSFYLAMFPITYYYFRKIGKLDFFPYAALIFIVNINAILYALGGVTDVIWITFFALSYIFRKNYIVSAIFLGFAFAFKQTVLIIIPFYLLFLYREELKSAFKVVKYIVIGSLTFLIINIPFIITAPFSWASSVFGIATQPVIGNGIGISILSFSGFFPVEIFVYYVLTIIASMTLFVIYYKNYDRMKYSFLAFPVFIFFFYYRLLLNYIMYWPFVMVIAFPDYLDSLVNTLASKLERSNERINLFSTFVSRISRFVKSRSTTSIVLVAILISSGVTYYGYVEETHNPLSIQSVNSFSNPYMINNSITSMNVLLNYEPHNGQPSSIPVFFRVYLYDIMNNGNGLLWYAGNNYISVGKTNLTIYPSDYGGILPDNISFKVIAYYGNYQSSYAESGKVAGFLGINNPYLAFPAINSGNSVPLGWNYYPYISNSYNFSIGTMTMTINSHGVKGKYKLSFNDPNINVSRLSLNKITYEAKSRLFNNKGEMNINNLVIKNISFGINLTFDNGKEYMIFEENNSGLNIPRSLSQSAMIFPSLVMNFTQIMNYAKNLHWDIQTSLTNMKFFLIENNNLNLSANFYNLTEVAQ